MVLDHIVVRFLQTAGGEDFYFSIWAVLFVFTILYFFYNVSK